MKKTILSLLIAASMFFLLAACDNTNTELSKVETTS